MNEDRVRYGLRARRQIWALLLTAPLWVLPLVIYAGAREVLPGFHGMLSRDVWRYMLGGRYRP